MQGRSSNPTLRLPQSLLEQIDEASGGLIPSQSFPSQLTHHLSTGGGKRKISYGRVTRKDSRKQQRRDRKTRKADHFSPPSGRPQPPPKGKRPASHDVADAPQRKKVKLAAPEHANRPAPQPASVARVDPPSNSPRHPSTKNKPHAPTKKTALQKLAEGSNSETKSAPSRRTQREDEEDAYITYLESQLGWRKGGKKTTKYGAGLDEEGWGGAWRCRMSPAHDMWLTNEILLCSLPT